MSEILIETEFCFPLPRLFEGQSSKVGTGNQDSYLRTCFDQGAEIQQNHDVDKQVTCFFMCFLFFSVCFHFSLGSGPCLDFADFKFLGAILFAS
jgi:hypothetical protein